MKLEEQFHQALEATVEAAKKRGYIPSYFIRMLAEYGGVETARRLLASDEPQEGLFKLYELGLLHDSMEAVVLCEQFKPLFTEKELAQAYKRLDDLGFFHKD